MKSSFSPNDSSICFDNDIANKVSDIVSKTSDHEKHILKLTVEHTELQRNIDDKFDHLNTKFASKYDITVLKQL
eukprot:6049254-Ditylum_brightwellii.AAC.1